MCPQKTKGRKPNHLFFSTLILQKIYCGFWVSEQPTFWGFHVFSGGHPRIWHSFRKRVFPMMEPAKSTLEEVYEVTRSHQKKNVRLFLRSTPSLVCFLFPCCFLFFCCVGGFSFTKKRAILIEESLCQDSVSWDLPQCNRWRKWQGWLFEIPWVALLKHGSVVILAVLFGTSPRKCVT